MCQMCDEYEAELQRMRVAMNDEIRLTSLEPETLEFVEQRAKEHGQTLDAVIKAILREEVDRQRVRRDPVAWSRAIRAMTPKGIAQTDSLTLLREDRDR